MVGVDKMCDFNLLLARDWANVSKKSFNVLTSPFEAVLA